MLRHALLCIDWNVQTQGRESNLTIFQGPRYVTLKSNKLQDNNRES